jgi:hypothetical protein
MSIVDQAAGENRFERSASGVILLKRELRFTGLGESIASRAELRECSSSRWRNWRS